MAQEQQRFWNISLFGGLEARCGERVLTRFKTRRAAILLARLACSPDRPLSRDVLTEELWPEDDPDAARLRFRQTLKLLRQELEPEEADAGKVVIADRFAVHLHRDAFQTDVAAFENALHHAPRAETHERQQEFLERAVALYRGELLPGFYEEWAVRERERLAERQRQSLEQLESLLTQAGQIHEATVYARQVVLADPYREEAHQRLIQLYARTGRVGEAHRQFRELKRLLQDEMASLPSPATLALMESLPLREEGEKGRRGEGKKNRNTNISPQQTDNSVLDAQTSHDNTSPQKRGAVFSPSPSLPFSLSRFFGREDEIRQIGEMLRPRAVPPAPLVTLLGNGGAGKTRLALEIVPLMREWYGDAVWSVGLAEVTDAARLMDTVAEAMGLPRSADVLPEERVAAALQEFPHALLVLDNFETVGREGSVVVQQLRRNLPHVACLVTSRQRLNVSGEKAFPLMPLPTPRKAGMPERLLEFPSVQLFVDRAQDARLSFALTPENAGTVAELCHALEGIPLAIELAAAWAAVLTPAQILARLTRRFDLLVSRQEDALERHRSLQAVLEGSLQTLPKSLQKLFAKLSVFRGGWTPDAAETICAEDGLPADTILDGLSLLSDRSFLWFEEQGATMRCSQLETLREFGSEQLRAEEMQTLAARHFAFFLMQAERVQSAIRTPDEKAALDGLETERDNLRAALQWAEQHSPAQGLKLVNIMANVWIVRGAITEGRAWTQRFLAATEEATAERAETLTNAALLAWYQGDYPSAMEFARQSLAIRQILGDKEGEAAALNSLAAAAIELGQVAEAEAGFRRSLELHREMDNARGITIQLVNVGNIAFYRGEYASSCAFYEEALTQRRALGDQRGIASAMDYLARSKRELGDYARACALHEESLALRRSLDDKAGIAYCLTRLGATLICLKQEERALSVLEEACECWRLLGDESSVTDAQYHLGRLHWRRGDAEAAKMLWHNGLRLRQRLNELPGLPELLEALAGLPHPSERKISVVRWLGCADALRERISLPVRASVRPAYDATLHHLQEALSAEAFRTAWMEGRALSLEQAIAEALRF